MASLLVLGIISKSISVKLKIGDVQVDLFVRQAKV